jgi:hypothetical protein
MSSTSPAPPSYPAIVKAYRQLEVNLAMKTGRPIDDEVACPHCHEDRLETLMVDRKSSGLQCRSCAHAHRDQQSSVACACCARPGYVEEHHVVSRSGDHRHLTVWLCGNCHQQITAVQQAFPRLFGTAWNAEVGRAALDFMRRHHPTGFSQICQHLERVLRGDPSSPAAPPQPRASGTNPSHPEPTP